jgi:acetylglutamate kinase
VILEKGPYLVQAAPWIQAFAGRYVVVKIGGETLERPAAVEKIARQIAVLRACGIKPVVVHGAGVQMDQHCRDRGIPIEKVAGRRITTPEVLGVLVEVLGDLNSQLCLSLKSQGLEAWGMAEGVDQAIRCTRRPPSEKEGALVHWGEVGDITDVDASMITRPEIPVLPSLGHAPDGPKNINADSCAARIGMAIQAVKLVFLTSTPGVMRDMDDDGPISEIDAETMESLLREGRIKGGMQAKLEESFRALKGGVEQVVILSGREPFGLLREIYTDEGVGTLIRR